ncbi:kinase-like domain-containing protein [Glomus cerebriforme]|uniref:Kinase-like domain-containing protein n=1 Tax=Glomus cerebriforme TaxID=658196 RepID=A0A397SKI1_9GLOM|nr:kinase-like domain-containing protein [Glomus cerebriforme]
MTEEIVRVSVTAMKNVNDAVGPFLPFVTLITGLTKEIAEAYENVQYNKKTCGTLVNRVEAAEAAIKGLMRQKEENIEKFCSQDYYDSFLKFVNCLKHIKEFFYDISQLSKFKKFYTSGNIKETFERIIKEFDGCSIDLNLAISLATNDQLNKDLIILHSDIIEMMKFLDNVEGGITSIDNQTKVVITNVNEIHIQNQDIIIRINNIEEQNNKIIEQNKKILEYEDKHESLDFTPLNTEIETISILNKEVNNQHSKIDVKAKRIDPSKIKDNPQYVARKGSRITIQKRIYKEMDVACKPISMDNIQRIQKHLAILKKLDACHYIIQFHGLSEINGENVMIFEWAEFGNLRELYQQYNIEWNAKISIARNICRGLIFLHTVEILHHDIRCENVLITENMQPKLCNFKFSREFNAATIPIDDMNDIIHWLAPEKLSHISTTEKDSKKANKKQDEASYTIQCDIFSFAMLLWELGFQKKPYENMNMSQIQKHVLKGGREILDFGLNPNSMQSEYRTIIELAWAQEPSLRPGIQHIFNMLQNLYEKHVLQRGSPSLQPKMDEFDENLQNLTVPDIGHISKVTPLIPFKEGLLAHKDKNYEKAWKCFEEHAKVGDILAKYWQGYYYLEGRFVEKNYQKAKNLFKDAADGGNADAQLRYAFCLIDKENDNMDRDNFLKYLKMSADKNNPTALYNLGEIYFQGKMGIEKDKNKGIQYLKLAALHNQPKAKEILNDYHINLYS